MAAPATVAAAASAAAAAPRPPAPGAGAPPSALVRSFLGVQVWRAQLYSAFGAGFAAFLASKNEPAYRALMGDLTTAFAAASQDVIALEARLREAGRADLAAVLRTVQEAERDKLRLTLTLQALQQAHAFRTFSWQQQGGAWGHGGAGGEEGGGDGGLDEEEALALLDPHYRGAASDAHHHHHHQHHEHHHQHEHPTAHGSENGHQEHAGESEGEGGRDCNGSEQGARVGAEGPRGNGAAHGSSGCGCGGAGGPPEPTRREWRAALREAVQELDARVRTINGAIEDLRCELEDLEE